MIMQSGGLKKWGITLIPLLVFIIGFTLFSSSFIYANEDGENEVKLNLSQVVELALAKESNVLDAQDNFEIAQSNLRLAQKEKGFNPIVEVSGDLSLVGETDSNLLVSVSDSLALNETSSKLADQFQQADLEVKKAQNTLENAQENAKLKAITAYFEVLKAEWTKELAQQTLEQAQILQSDLENQYQLGMASSLDLLQAQQTVENSRINLDQSEKSLLLKKQQLNQMIGYP